MSETLTSFLKMSPMMEQYRSVKKTLPKDTILFFRLGDFYEMFFEDAVRASEILDITLTGREGGEAGRVPMCGVPYHSYQVYVRGLLDRNLKVAICEQIGDPRASRGLVERKVTRIITPATYLEEERAGLRQERLSAVVSDGKRAAIASLDLGTGEFSVREVPLERLAGELSLASPREVILPASLSQDSGWAASVQGTLKASLTVYEDWVFGEEEAQRSLAETFGFGSPKSLAFHERVLAVRACGAVLYYLKDHLHSSLGHVRVPALLATSDFMGLDRQAVASLELVAPSIASDRTQTLAAVVDRTLTAMGARSLGDWITRPLLSIPEIERRQDAVEGFAHEREVADGLRALLKGVRDMERALSRLGCGVANGRDLVNLRDFLERVPDLRALLARASSALAGEILSGLKPFESLRELLARAIVDVAPLTMREGGLIRDGFSLELDELRALAKSGKTWIADFERREIQRTGIKSLRVKYNQVFGYAIEVSKPNLHLVPLDYTRRQTLANAERFIVPELKSWDDRISGAEERTKALEFQLFNEVRDKVLKDLRGLQDMARAVGVLDALLSFALVARERGWVRPTVVESGELLIEGGRHPVVEAMLPAGQFVENDTFLDGAENQLVVLTGPNMAGKSTYIRQVALIAILAQAGSFVPAARARIGVVDRIFTRVGASDDLARGESTFMVEMLETAAILQAATRRSLLILDEVGRGTSTFDGVSIAWAICEYLAEGPVRPRTLFATHYHELTQLEAHFPGIKNYNITVREKPGGIVFLRKVVRGGSDRSYGIHVARLAGIPRRVTDRADEILGILESESTEATRIIEGGGRSSRASQPDLFDAQEPHPILRELQNLPLDGLTPLAALNQVAAWQERLQGSDKEKS